MIFCENLLLNILIRVIEVVSSQVVTRGWTGCVTLARAASHGHTSPACHVSRVTNPGPGERKQFVGKAEAFLFFSLFFTFHLTFCGYRGIKQEKQNCLCRSKLKFEIMILFLHNSLLFVSAGRGMACSANHSKGSGHGSSSAHGAQHGGGLIVGPGAWLQRKVHLRPQHRGVHLVTDEILRGVSAHQFGNVHKCRDTSGPPCLQ